MRAVVSNRSSSAGSVWNVSTGVTKRLLPWSSTIALWAAVTAQSLRRGSAAPQMQPGSRFDLPGILCTLARFLAIQVVNVLLDATLSAYPKNVTDASLCVGISGIGMPLVRFFG